MLSTVLNFDIQYTLLAVVFGFQIAEATYPYVTNPPSAKEKLCHTAVHCLNTMFQSIRRYGAEEGEGGTENHCRYCKGVVDVGSVHIPLGKLLKFPRIQQLCSSEDLEEIRFVSTLIF
jgi:hypothetical protein